MVVFGDTLQARLSSNRPRVCDVALKLGLTRAKIWLFERFQEATPKKLRKQFPTWNSSEVQV